MHAVSTSKVYLFLHISVSTSRFYFTVLDWSSELQKQKLDTTNCFLLYMGFSLQVCISCCPLTHNMFEFCLRHSMCVCVCLLVNFLGLVALPLAFPSWTKRKGQPHPVWEKRDRGWQDRAGGGKMNEPKQWSLLGLGCFWAQRLCLCVWVSARWLRTETSCMNMDAAVGAARPTDLSSETRLIEWV